MSEDAPDVLQDPEYKRLANELDQCVRSIHRFLEDFGNEHDLNEDSHPENSMVSGWVLAIGQVGFQDGREFHAALVEMPDSTNTFMAIGLVDYARRFLADQTADYSTLTDY